MHDQLGNIRPGVTFNVKTIGPPLEEDAVHSIIDCVPVGDDVYIGLLSNGSNNLFQLWVLFTNLLCSS